MTPPTVPEARRNILDQVSALRGRFREYRHDWLQGDLDALIAAVRAEERRTCVKDLRDYAKEMTGNRSLHPFVIAADFIDIERAERLRADALNRADARLDSNDAP